MIKPELVANVLRGTNSGGIKCTVLFNKDGTLVASAGSWKGEDPDVTASAVSGIWTTYEKARLLSQAAPHPKLNCLVLEYDNGLVGLIRIEGTSTLVCCLSDATEEMGLLRRKVVNVAECVRELVQHS